MATDFIPTSSPSGLAVRQLEVKCNGSAALSQQAINLGFSSKIPSRTFGYPPRLVGFQNGGCECEPKTKFQDFLKFTPKSGWLGEHFEWSNARNGRWLRKVEEILSAWITTVPYGGVIAEIVDCA